MEKRFIVRYDQTLDSNFYMCRGCRTDIALIKDSILTHKRFGAVLLKHADNLVIENPEDYVDIVCITVAFVYCGECTMYLGWKCVDIVDGPSDLC
ncbi:hypothetical protein Pint_19911 [Pistacia integerrima]|uniref:Uncharacterized protein n=1 Tax=Pistacia integerrima TaxID=434235 RepID=A0ACC0X8L5_9ROSI|nr:hypothetical protein Pint_19911 [Pistacia integerrima]